MSRANPYRLGQTASSGELENLLGQCACFEDIDYSSTEAVKPLLTGMDVWARWVKNESGGALTPGTCVVADTGATYGPGKAVGAAAVSGTTVANGVVDPYIASAGVANDAHFWLIYCGPCKFKFTTGTALTVGAVLQLGAAGRVELYDVGTPAIAANLDRCGRALAAVASGTADDTLFRGFADFRF